MAQILWSPESGQCSQCGSSHIMVRRFTSDGFQTFFCEECWKDFILECNIPIGIWQAQIATNWRDFINLELDCDNGTSQTIEYN
jgi:transposase-like protein